MNDQSSFQSARFVRALDFFWFFFQGLGTGARTIFFFAFLFTLLAAGNTLADTNAAPLTASGSPVISPVTAPLSATPYPDAGLSLVRVIGALALVLGIFFGGVWLFRNWQRLSIQRGRQPKLNILETRSLGSRQAVFVVAYERQRFLVSTSTAGVNLLSHLPDAEANEAESAAQPGAPMSFGQALAQVLKKK